MSPSSRSLRSRLVRWSLGSLGSVSLLLAVPAEAVNITWIGGNAQWDDGGSTANWNPADEPDSNDAALFNTNNIVTLGTANVINGLTMSASSELLLNGNALTVDGATTLSGAGTRLELAGASSVLNAADMLVASGGTVFLDGGTINSLIVGATNSTVTTNVGGTLSGNGELTMNDSLAAVTTLINNNGTISATNPSTVLLLPPAIGTLHIVAADADARIDLDGSLEGGIVNVTRNQTLDVDVQLADIFNGAITMTQETKLDIASGWTLGAGAVVNIDNGATGGLGGAPAGKATIAGGAFSQNSGAINVLDADGTLQFDAQFFLNVGTFTNNGHVIFNSNSQLTAGGTFVPEAGSKVTVESGHTLLIAQTNINLDADNSSPVEYVVNQGMITLSSTDYDSDVASNSFEGIITLNGGTFVSNTGDPSFVMNGTLNMSNVGGTAANWDGEAIVIGNDSLALDANLNVTGGGNVDFSENVTFQSDADVDVADGAVLRFISASNVTFNSVNGGNNAQFTGAGEIAFNGTVNFNEATTFNMAGGVIDFDGADSTGNNINVDAPVTLNVEQLRSFGKLNGVGTNILDVNNNVGTGVLTVNLDDPNAEWTINAEGQLNLVNDAAVATLLAGADVNINGQVQVSGDSRVDARIDLGSTANVAVGIGALRLSGGNTTDDPNTISGGSITGVSGVLAADTGTALHGYGTISTDIDFAGSANLRAVGGTLNVTDTITKVNQIGAETGAILNVVNPWNANVGVVGTVLMTGGTLQGAQVTVNTGNGIQGYGLVTSRVINNSKLLSVNGGPLVFETAGNDNDWDGAANNGLLHALSGDLELRDNATFTFGGTVTAVNSQKVYTKGFGFNFNASSTLNLTQGTLQSDETTTLNGTVVVGAGTESTINVQNNRFLDIETGSSTTLNGNLRLQNNNIIINQGATFSGPGAIIIPDGSHMVAENLADIGVLLDMQGSFRPGNSQGIARVDLFDFQTAPTSELYIELIGTALNAYDRLVVDGVAIVDGYLSLDIDDVSPGVPFVPSLGNTFNIITATSVTGTFDTVDVSGMPAGLAFRVNYLVNAVQLEVVNKPIYSADFDEDGDVDATDLAIWKNAFGLNQLGDADGDNDSDGADFLAWQRQYGSVPAVAAAGAVPEPNSFVLLAAAGAGIAALRRRELANLL